MSSDNMKQNVGVVLVTGADGFIGSHLCETLVCNGANVRAMCYYNSFGKNGWLDTVDCRILSEIELIAGDVRDPHFVSRAVKGVDVVLHLAALIAIPFSYVAPSSYIEVNVQGTLNVLESARQHDVHRLVHTSTSETYGTAQFTPITELHPLCGQSPYAATKIGADALVESYYRSFDLPTVTARPFNTFGPRQSERAVIPTVIRQFIDPDCSTVEIGDTTPVRDFNYVADICNGFKLAAFSDGVTLGETYNIGSGAYATVQDVIDIVRRRTSSDKPVKTDEKRIRPQKSEVFTLIADSTKFTKATGWKPSYSLDDGLSETIDWWKEVLVANQLRSTSTYLI